jgi:hypothetical protein
MPGPAAEGGLSLGIVAERDGGRGRVGLGEGAGRIELAVPEVADSSERNACSTAEAL